MKCLIDTRTLRTAQEAYRQQTGRYAEGPAELIAAGFLRQDEQLHRFEPRPAEEMADEHGLAPSSYVLVVNDLR